MKTMKSLNCCNAQKPSCLLTTDCIDRVCFKPHELSVFIQYFFKDFTYNVWLGSLVEMYLVKYLRRGSPCDVSLIGGVAAECVSCVGGICWCLVCCWCLLTDILVCLVYIVYIVYSCCLLLIISLQLMIIITWKIKLWKTFSSCLFFLMGGLKGVWHDLSSNF